MSKVPVSVCLIAKNEEKYIEGCLKSLQPYGFEIVVTDTGSTDRTVEIAAKYADKVLHFDWVNDFSAARNECAKHASNDWILALDCDEWVTSAQTDTLRLFMDKVPNYTGVLRMKNLVNMQDGSQGYSVDDVVRMYDRRIWHFENAVHEQICPRRPSREQMQTFLIPIEVIHYGYAVSPQEMARKQRRNLDILRRSLERSPQDAYLYFQIGQSEFILQEYEQAASDYERGLALSPPSDAAYTPIMIMSLARAYVELERRGEALALMERYAATYSSAKYVFTHASVCMDNNQPLKALMLYVKTTLLPDADTLGEGLIDCYGTITELYHKMGDEKMAALFQDKYDAAVREKNNVMKCVHN